jgi:hypothetical protein
MHQSDVIQISSHRLVLVICMVVTLVPIPIGRRRFSGPTSASGKFSVELGQGLETPPFRLQRAVVGTLNTQDMRCDSLLAPPYFTASAFDVHSIL